MTDKPTTSEKSNGPASSPYTPTGGPTRPELSAQVTDKRPMIIAAVVSAVLFILFILLLIFLYNSDQARMALRDISIIFLAILSVLVLLVMLIMLLGIYYIILKLNDLVYLIHHEVKPTVNKVDQLVESTKQTAQVVETRTTLIADELVKPVIGTVSTFSALRAILNTLFRR